MSSLRAWIQAARPLAQANLFTPLLLGQALAYRITGAFSWRHFLFVHAFGVLNQLFIVFANDAADWKGDVINRTFNRFSGGSRVVPDKKLTPYQLAIGSMVALLAMSLLSVYLVFTEHRFVMVVLCGAAAFLMWAYSFPPLRLSYRGHGELLQALGLGVVLVFIGYHIQSGRILGLPWKVLLPPFLLGYAGNMTTALPDTPADRVVGKRTYPVRRGEREARRDSLIVISVAVLSTPLILPGAPVAVLLGVVALPLAFVLTNARRLGAADAENHAECERFVLFNGAAIHSATLAWALTLFFG